MIDTGGTRMRFRITGQSQNAEVLFTIPAHPPPGSAILFGYAYR